jgi:hypothetical protein
MSHSVMQGGLFFWIWERFSRLEKIFKPKNIIAWFSKVKPLDV